MVVDCRSSVYTHGRVSEMARRRREEDGGECTRTSLRGCTDLLFMALWSRRRGSLARPLFDAALSQFPTMKSPNQITAPNAGGPHRLPSRTSPIARVGEVLRSAASHLMHSFQNRCPAKGRRRRRRDFSFATFASSGDTPISSRVAQGVQMGPVSPSRPGCCSERAGCAPV